MWGSPNHVRDLLEVDFTSSTAIDIDGLGKITSSIELERGIMAWH